MPDAGGGRENEYLGLQLGPKFMDGAREMERMWLHTCRERGIWRLWWLIYCALHGVDPRTGANNANAELQFVGKDQQYALFRVQLARRFIHQRKMMAKDQRPSFEGTATTNDVPSLAEVNISTRAIQYLTTEAKLEQEANGALGALCNYGMGGILSGWDYHAGDDVPAKEPEIGVDGNPVQLPVIDDQGNPVAKPDPETGELVQQTQTQMRDVQKPSGAPKFKKLYPWQIVFEPYIEQDHTSIITKTPVNKFELAAKFPELWDRIVGLSIDDEMGDDALFAWGGANAVGSHTVVLRQYFEKSSEIVPGGRWAGYVQDVPLWGVDEIVPCPLKKGLPVKIMVGPRYDGTGFGYPESGDLLSLQTVINEIVSMMVTNMQKRGNANAYKRDDVQIDLESWSNGGGLHDIPAGAEKPEWDEPPEIGSLAQYGLEFCLEQARGMLGSNSVTEGNPTANISSGAFGVLMVNVAQRYVSDIQEAYDTCLVEAANDALELARNNAENGFWAEIAGIGDAPYTQIITNSQLKSLKRVKLVRKSPVLSTFMGVLEVFDRTVGLPKRERADAMEMLLNSDTSSFAERDQAARIRIRKENEQMLQGTVPPVASWDDHATEGPMHRMQYDKLRTMDPPDDGPQTPPPPPPPDGPKNPEYQQVYQAWLATGGPAYASWDKACKAHEEHLQGHALALAITSPEIAIVAGWAPLVSPDQQTQQGQGQGKSTGGAQDKAGPKGGQRAPQAPKPPSAPSAPKGAGGLGRSV